MNTKNLLSVAVGNSAVIDSLSASGALRRRLLDLGFIPGAVITCLYAAPSGDPRAYMVHSTVIALRNQDALNITIA